jgi:hypothetical protein
MAARLLADHTPGQDGRWHDILSDEFNQNLESRKMTFGYKLTKIPGIAPPFESGNEDAQYLPSFDARSVPEDLRVKVQTRLRAENVVNGVLGSSTVLYIMKYAFPELWVASRLVQKLRNYLYTIGGIPFIEKQKGTMCDIFDDAVTVADSRSASRIVILAQSFSFEVFGVLYPLLYKRDDSIDLAKTDLLHRGIDCSIDRMFDSEKGWNEIKAITGVGRGIMYTAGSGRKVTYTQVARGSSTRESNKEMKIKPNPGPSDFNISHLNITTLEHLKISLAKLAEQHEEFPELTDLVAAYEMMVTVDFGTLNAQAALILQSPANLAGYIRGNNKSACEDAFRDVPAVQTSGHEHDYTVLDYATNAMIREPCSASNCQQCMIMRVSEKVMSRGLNEPEARTNPIAACHNAATSKSQGYKSAPFTIYPLMRGERMEAIITQSKVKLVHLMQKGAIRSITKDNVEEIVNYLGAMLAGREDRARKPRQVNLSPGDHLFLEVAAFAVFMEIGISLLYGKLLLATHTTDKVTEDSSYQVYTTASVAVQPENTAHNIVVGLDVTSMDNSSTFHSVHGPMMSGAVRAVIKSRKFDNSISWFGWDPMSGEVNAPGICRAMLAMQSMQNSLGSTMKYLDTTLFVQAYGTSSGIRSTMLNNNTVSITLLHLIAQLFNTYAEDSTLLEWMIKEGLLLREDVVGGKLVGFNTATPMVFVEDEASIVGDDCWAVYHYAWNRAAYRLLTFVLEYGAKSFGWKYNAVKSWTSCVNQEFLKKVIIHGCYCPQVTRASIVTTEKASTITYSDMVKQCTEMTVLPLDRGADSVRCDMMRSALLSRICVVKEFAAPKPGKTGHEQTYLDIRAFMTPGSVGGGDARVNGCASQDYQAAIHFSCYIPNAYTLALEQLRRVSGRDMSYDVNGEGDFQAGITECRALIGKDNFDHALTALESAIKKYPDLENDFIGISLKTAPFKKALQGVEATVANSRKADIARSRDLGREVGNVMVTPHDVNTMLRRLKHSYAIFFLTLCSDVTAEEPPLSRYEDPTVCQFVVSACPRRRQLLRVLGPAVAERKKSPLDGLARSLNQAMNPAEAEVVWATVVALDYPTRLLVLQACGLSAKDASDVVHDMDTAHLPADWESIIYRGYSKNSSGLSGLDLSNNRAKTIFDHDDMIIALAPAAKKLLNSVGTQLNLSSCINLKDCYFEEFDSMLEAEKRCRRYPSLVAIIRVNEAKYDEVVVVESCKCAVGLPEIWSGFNPGTDLHPAYIKRDTSTISGIDDTLRVLGYDAVHVRCCWAGCTCEHAFDADCTFDADAIMSMTRQVPTVEVDELYRSDLGSDFYSHRPLYRGNITLGNRRDVPYLPNVKSLDMIYRPGVYSVQSFSEFRREAADFKFHDGYRVFRRRMKPVRHPRDEGSLPKNVKWYSKFYGRR